MHRRHRWRGLEISSRRLPPRLLSGWQRLLRSPGPALMLVAASMGKAKDRSGRTDADAVLNIDAPQLKGTITLSGDTEYRSRTRV
jgi:hypothetical protein